MKRLILLLLWLAACTPQLPNPANVTSVTAVPTVDMANPADLCQAAQHRSRDWEQTIEALQVLIENELDCGGNIPLETQLYTAYLAYGSQLEADRQRTEAQAVYEAAFALNPTGIEAQERLIGMRGYFQPTVIPPAECDADEVELEDYTSSKGEFVRLGDAYFIFNGEPFYVRGVNYFPRDTPFRHFLTETELESVETEMALMQASAINTLRIFLYNADLFACPDTNAIPIIENFERLDGIIQLAAEHNLRLIVVLNNEPDLIYHPLYTNPEWVEEQTRFIVERYRDEPTILAWDVRDRGDLDYRYGDFPREQVLIWVAETVVLIREIDTNHPITAGWWQNALDTAPLVDFVSFQFYGEYATFRQEIANLRASANRPILLTSIGYSTFTLDEVTQRNLLYQAFEEVHQNDLMGWVVYMAFDYPRTATCIEPDCPGTGMVIDHYGIWNTSYFRKLAVDAVEIMTGVQE
jgi:hypothetical protein